MRIEQSVDAIRAALAAGYVVVYGFTVYPSFMGPYTSRTGIMLWPKPGEAVQGGHANVICGFNDATERFKSRNCWGRGWGDNGYGYMHYQYAADSDLASDFWAIETIS